MYDFKFCIQKKIIDNILSSVLFKYIDSVYSYYNVADFNNYQLNLVYTIVYMCSILNRL